MPDDNKAAPQTVSTTCTVCNCVLWVETVDAHMKADHPDTPKPDQARVGP